MEPCGGSHQHDNGKGEFLQNLENRWGIPGYWASLFQSARMEPCGGALQQDSGKGAFLQNPENRWGFPRF